MIAAYRQLAVFFSSWNLVVPLLVVLGGGGAGSAQELVSLREQFPAGYQYHVSARVELAGALSVPGDKGQAPKSLSVSGDSAIEYDELILAPGADGKQKTLRVYRRMDFHRKIGDKLQESAIRPSVRRMVVLRHENVEVPFSPDGPLTWEEIDLVRTDVFTPALVGLLPDKAVKPGDRWTAVTAAIQELTDMERIEDGRVECRFEQVTTLADRPYARVAFNGTVRGINEDGPNRQQLDGYFYFDLKSNHLSYLSLKGTSSMLDKEGKTLGSVGGQFVLTRQPQPRSKDFSEDVLRRLVVEPNADNTMLLFENPQLGIRFLYPRRWRVAGVHGPQVALDEAAGSGLLLSIEQPSRVPSAQQFLTESRDFFQKQKAKIFRIDQPRRVAGTALEHFSFDMEINAQRVLMDYYVIPQQTGGATLAARLLPRDLPALQQDVERIARSVQIGNKAAR
jgi:hypothetical protein